MVGGEVFGMKKRNGWNIRKTMNKILIDLMAVVVSVIFRRNFNWVRTEIVIKRWRKKGVSIGENCYVNYDVRLEPGVSIGDGTTITGGSLVLTHDAVPATFIEELSREHGVYDRKCRRADVSIGRQCFIGANCVILPGITIGDRCIIAAGSIVTKDVSSGNVVAGNPAKVVCSIDEYIVKQRNLYEANREIYR